MRTTSTANQSHDTAASSAAISGPGMRRLLLGLIACIALGLIGCETKRAVRTSSKRLTGKDRQTLQSYYPIKVGDKRVYKIRYGTTNKVIQRTIRITHKRGNQFFDNHNEPYRFDTYGLRSQNKRYLLKHPLRKGYKWLSVTGYLSVERYEIVNTNRTVTVPAGTYSRCVVVHSKKKIGPRRTNEAVFYYAPQIGPVKISIYVRMGGKRIPQWSYELVAYTPGKG